MQITRLNGEVTELETFEVLAGVNGLDLYLTLLLDYGAVGKARYLAVIPVGVMACCGLGG